jgi:hypothetical protein
MSRQDRLDKEYSKPLSGWQGNARDQKNIDRWSERATANSQCAPRASDGPMKLPSTKVNQRDSDMRPYRPRTNVATNADELNIEGDSPFMRDVRRQV